MQTYSPNQDVVVDCVEHRTKINENQSCSLFVGHGCFDTTCRMFLSIRRLKAVNYLLVRNVRHYPKRDYFLNNFG